MSRSGTVCILTSVHPPFDTRVFHKEARTLVEAGFDVTLVVPHDRNETVDGVRIHALAKPRSRSERVLRTTWQLLHSALKADARVYHFHDPELIPVGLLLRVFGKRVIYDVHEYYREKIRSKGYLPKWLRPLLAGAFDVFESVASRFFNGVIVADRVTAAKFSGRSVSVFNYPYLPSLKTPNEAERSECFQLAYVGSITDDRGLLPMVDAMDELSDGDELLLIGPFGTEAERRRAEARPGFRRVRALGRLPWPEAMALVSKADLGLAVFQPVPAYLYAGENTVKLFEYMMLGVPLIASDFPNLREIVEAVDCGILVDPTDPSAIAAAVRRLKDDAELRAAMGTRGAAAVRDRYNWAHSARTLLELYDHVLDGRQSVPAIAR